MSGDACGGGSGETPTEGDREPLAFAYQGDELVAVAYKRWFVHTLRTISKLDVVKTPRDPAMTDGGSTGGNDRLDPSVYESSIDGYIYAECPTCTNTIRLGDLWADLILNEGKDVPPCPECDDGSGDTWADEADVIVDGHELWACMGDPLDLDEGHSEVEI